MNNRAQARVIIAEDNPVAREVLRGIIRGDDRLKLVGEAANGQIALEMVEALRPDLVCLDVLMPGLDGLEVLRAIASGHPHTRVILVTGQSTSQVVTEALAQGACGFVVKPFSAEKLLRAIHGALDRPKPEVTSPEPAPADASPAAAAATADDAMSSVAATGQASSPDQPDSPPAPAPTSATS